MFTIVADAIIDMMIVIIVMHRILASMISVFTDMNLQP